MSCLLGLVKHARACRTFSKITMYRYLREGWELFCWIWPSISKILWNNKLAISLERVEWFCCFLHVVICILLISLEATIICYFGLALLGIGYQRIRLSDVLNLKNMKTVWGNKSIFCFHWSYKKYAILDYDPKILLANQFAGFFTFDLFELLILIPVVYCCIVLVHLGTCATSIFVEIIRQDKGIWKRADKGIFRNSND